MLFLLLYELHWRYIVFPIHSWLVFIHWLPWVITQSSRLYFVYRLCLTFNNRQFIFQLFSRRIWVYEQYSTSYLHGLDFSRPFLSNYFTFIAFNSIVFLLFTCYIIITALLINFYYFPTKTRVLRYKFEILNLLKICSVINSNRFI